MEIRDGIEIYDFLILKSNNIYSKETIPAWTYGAIKKYPLVVVRRGVCENNAMIPIGIRGDIRTERFGCFTEFTNIKKVIKPENIECDKSNSFYKYYKQIENVLMRLHNNTNKRIINWGIVGSIGYEIATKICCTNDNSDIDVLIKSEKYFDKEIGARILFELDKLDRKIDIVVMTKKCIFSLREFVVGKPPYLLKYVGGESLGGIKEMF